MAAEFEIAAQCDRVDPLSPVSADPAGVVFVDFEEAIFSCNSTDLFVASCKPSPLVALIDFLVRQCIPWRFTKLSERFRLRDYICVLLILLLMPWNFLLWKRRAPALFARFENCSVRNALPEIDPARVVIVALNLHLVVRPMLRGSRWDQAQLVAMPLLSAPSRFARGKLAIAGAELGDGVVGVAPAEAPNFEDALPSPSRGIVLDAQRRDLHAAEHLYIPLRYTARAKYTHSYVLDQFLLVNSLLCLAVARPAWEAFEALTYVPLLVLSFMCVYELGYFENDMVAARREERPTLKATVEDFVEYPISPAAWLWAICLGSAGIAIAARFGQLRIESVPAAILFWIGSLLVLRLINFTYNRQPARIRMLIYPLLQFMKFGPVFVLVHPTLIGVLLALSQLTTMWVTYMAYRLGADSKAIPKEVFRTGLFAAAIGFLMTAGLLHARDNIVVLTMIGMWSAIRIAKPMVLHWARRGNVDRALASTPAAAG